MPVIRTVSGKTVSFISIEKVPLVRTYFSNLNDNLKTDLTALLRIFN